MIIIILIAAYVLAEFIAYFSFRHFLSSPWQQPHLTDAKYKNIHKRSRQFNSAIYVCMILKFDARSELSSSLSSFLTSRFQKHGRLSLYWGEYVLYLSNTAASIWTLIVLLKTRLNDFLKNIKIQNCLLLVAKRLSNGSTAHPCEPIKHQVDFPFRESSNMENLKP